MGIIRRGTIATEYVDSLKLDIGNKDPVPNQTSDKVVLTYDYSNNRKAQIVRVTSATNSTSATVYTTPTDEDFYVSSVFISVIKDATSTSTSSAVSATIDGVSQNLIRIASITLTAQQMSYSVSFPVPIKVDRGTNIVVQNTTNVANITASGGITGWRVAG